MKLQWTTIGLFDNARLEIRSQQSRKQFRLTAGPPSAKFCQTRSNENFYISLFVGVMKACWTKIRHPPSNRNNSKQTTEISHPFSDDINFTLMFYRLPVYVHSPSPPRLRHSEKSAKVERRWCHSNEVVINEKICHWTATAVRSAQGVFLTAELPSREFIVPSPSLNAQRETT